MPDSRFSIGIDVGATKTRLLAQSSQSEDLIEVQGAAANPKRVGMERATAVLVDLIGEVFGPSQSVERLSICAGVAGAGRREEQNALARRLTTALQEQVDSIRVDIVHDALIALETAFGAGSGLVVITGTGSVSLARTDDEDLVRAGGWGHLLGDPGSGYAIGRAGLRAVAQAFEGGADTTLRERLQQHFEVTNRDALLQTVYNDDFHIQDVAPLVCQVAAAGDSTAKRILAQQTDRLAEQVGWLVERCSAVTPRIALHGGMVRNNNYAETLRRTLLDRLPQWSVEVLQEDPVVGGLRRAHRLHSTAPE